MYEPQCFYLLVYMAAAAISISSAFNIDTANATVHRGEKKDFFGYKVLQYMSPRSKGIIVTAPLRLNGSGGIFKLDQDQTEKWFSPNGSSETRQYSAKHLGLSIAPDPTASRFFACIPSLAHPCDENVYLNSLCYNITDDFQLLSSFKPLFQKCIKKTVNLVFLFDGSESMTAKEFYQNKVFINKIMSNLTNTSITFSAVQFATNCRTVFDFNDYIAGTALDKLEKEEHMKALTNTHKALNFTLKELLENPATGALQDAIKAVVIITDGNPSDTDRNYKSVETYELKKITRVVIGVKKVDLEKLKAIASEPRDKNALKIENYDGLTEILESFQKQIFNIEGSRVIRSEELKNEMSQSGFSAASHKGTLILGSVGSNSWRGALIESKKSEKNILDPDMQQDSYMGYSLSVGERNGNPLYFTGAPRFNHKGQVVVFQRDKDKWKTAQRITEDKIGSYFGAELCSVDIDSDGNTDFLLVGAPTFFLPEERKEGKIYIYSLSDEMVLTRELEVDAPSMGRFGTTITSLSDLNGDGLRDVAVGAPLEEDNAGAIYIYLGQRGTGIHTNSSQRITGAQFHPGLRFFGQAINGDIDLGDDRLPDIVVGSQGAVVVLRSKAVLNVKAKLSFSPNEISIQEITCLKTGPDLPMVTIRACFELVETTNSAAGPGINISVMLNVDPTRQTYRGFFYENEGKSRNITKTYELTNAQTCFNYSISMNKCVKDTLTPVNIKLNFFQPDSEKADGILDVYSKRWAVVEVPFEKHCDKKEICIADLKVDFEFTASEVLVTEDNSISVLIRLNNNADDSYNTSLIMHYPPGLSFSKMEQTEEKKLTYICTGPEDVLDETVCGISPPVYRSKSSATFNVFFRIAKDFQWNDTMSMTFSAKSDNSNSSKTPSVSKSIPVKYSVDMAIAKKDTSTSYLAFTSEKHAPQRMTVIYIIENTGFKDFPINVSLSFPSSLEHNFKVTNYAVIVEPNKTKCSVISTQTSEDCPLKETCVAIQCDTFTLKNYSGVQFSLVGDVHFQNLKNHESNMPFLKRYTGDGAEVHFTSFIKVHCDGGKYLLASHKHEKKNQTDNGEVKKSIGVLVEFKVPQNRLLIIVTGAILGFILMMIIAIIMYKRGCFKRKTMEEMDSSSAQIKFSPVSSPNKPEQKEQEKQPLNAEKVKDSPSVSSKGNHGNLD